MSNRKGYSINSQKFLSVDELDQLERLCRKRLSGDSQRDALLLLIAIKTGGRAMEILNIRRRHFNKTQKTIYLMGLKGSNDREIPLPDFLSREIDYYCRERSIGVDDRLFNISYMRLYQIWDFYRPAKKKFHSLRHTFAIKVYMQTRDVKLVQLCLGHRSIMNTMVYVDFIYTLDQMRRILF